MSGEEGGEKLSKKQLKKLAKKAERDAKKGKGDAAPAAAGKAEAKKDAKAPAAGKAEAAAAPSAPKKTVYYLANASSDNCVATLKASIAASAFGVQLSRVPPGQKTLPSLFAGPALYASTNTSVVAFGGNGIAKAISLIGNHDNKDAVVIDEWLEVERTGLRKNLAPKVKAAALEKVDEALTTGCGSFLVNGTLSTADIAVVTSLVNNQGEGEKYGDAIQAYIDAHMSSPAFVGGIQGVEALVPPPPFDIDNDPSMKGAVNSVFLTAITGLVPELAAELGEVVEKCKVLKQGDYQCKEAMPLFSKLKKMGSLPSGINSPQQLAQAIIAAIPGDNPVVDELSMNGPGFITCRVKASYLEHHVNTFMNSSKGDGEDPKLPLPKTVTSKSDTVVVDFSSPNIAKEMHVGHLRSTIIGECVCRILEFTGANVKRVNHVGDWGTQFGMLITYLKEEFPNFGKEDSEVDIGGLTAFYKKAKVSVFSMTW